MSKYNASNERIKREYLCYLKQAKGRDAVTLDGVAKALSRFEESIRWKDFKRFDRRQAVAFREAFGERTNSRTGERLSRATVFSTLRNLREFFFWLAHQPGFKTHIGYADCDYFNLSEKEMRVARARREKRVPTMEQVEQVLSTMPATNAIERRDQAVVALAAMTGARIGALSSFRHGDVNLDEGFIEQDGRTVRTKFGKTFRSYFLPVSERALAIFTEWHNELEHQHLWGPADPLFPATEIGLGEEGSFTRMGISRRGWSTGAPIREIFKKAFEGADLPYSNPHSFRDMLVRHAFSLNLTPQEMKAWSQNLGHADVMTTFTSYGQLPTHRQGELIRQSGNCSKVEGATGEEIAALKSILAKAQGNQAER